MELADFFKKYKKAAVAFSGGVDSAYLLYAALESGAEVRAYCVKSAFQPRFELEDAKRAANQLKADIKVISLDVLSSEKITENSQKRCYHCKRMIFEAILKEAAADGFTVVLDGTNASDEESLRPGMRALRELEILSPLRECGLTKDKIRALSKEAGLFTWDKPAYACLATRIGAGEQITAEKLKTTEAAEDFLSSLGFTDFRVRMSGSSAKLQLCERQLGRLLSHREKIVSELKKYYTSVLLDLEVRE